MDKLIDFDMYAIKITLKQLLKDKSTKNNIIWATNTYEHLGPEFDDKKEIKEFTIINGFKLKPRITKSEEIKLERTKKKAEVFTPSWLVNQMNNYCDEEWLGKNNTFNIENDNSWEVIDNKITFPKEKNWKDYINSTRLEITCGEAPFLVSRYDVSTGEKLVPTLIRMGMLDRKLRIVNENTHTKEEWIEWAIKAVQSCYGYEYQGDNVLLARMNILLTYVEYFEERWDEKVEDKILLKLANIISWNIWQMDGLTDTVPFGAPYEEHKQISMFDLEEIEEKESIPCRIFDWRGNKSIRFMDLKERRMKKFDFVIGNPPYQEETTKITPKGNGQIRTRNIFPLFQEFADNISEEGIVLIFPGARWIHRSGKGTAKFGFQQINDKRLSQLIFYPNSKEVFDGVAISDGVSIVVKNMKKMSEGFKYTYINNGKKSYKHVKNPGESLMPLDPKDIDVVNKIDKFIEENNLSYLHNRVLSQKFFGIESNFIESNKDKSILLEDAKTINYETQIKLFTNDKAGKAGRSRWFVVNKDLITKNKKFIDEWQVIVSSANAGGQKRDNQISIIDNHSAFGRSRVALGTFKTKEEAQNFYKYCNSMIIKYTFLMTDENLSSLAKRVPDLLNYNDDNNYIDFSKNVDKQLKRIIGLDNKEYEHIINKVKNIRSK